MYNSKDLTLSSYLWIDTNSIEYENDYEVYHLQDD